MDQSLGTPLQRRILCTRSPAGRMRYAARTCPLELFELLRWLQAGATREIFIQTCVLASGGIPDSNVNSEPGKIQRFMLREYGYATAADPVANSEMAGISRRRTGRSTSTRLDT